MLRVSSRASYHTLLDALVLKQADDTPCIIMLEADRSEAVVTRRQFRQGALQAAQTLKSLGAERGDLVLISQTHGLAGVLAFWGALLLHAIPAMMPAMTEKLQIELYTAGLKELVRISGVRLVLTTSQNLVVLHDVLACNIASLDLFDVATNDCEIPGVAVRPNATETAFLQHSSGTTGLQKGVALSHYAVLNQLASYADAIHLNEHDVIISWLPLYHDMGLIASFLQPLMQGIPVVLMSPLDWARIPSLLLYAIDRFRGSLCWLPNFAFQHLTHKCRQRDTQELDLSSMRAFINCSEPVQAVAHQRFLDRFAENGVHSDMLSVSYAMAENTFAVTQTAPGTSPNVETVNLALLQSAGRAVPAISPTIAHQHVVSCGKPIHGTEIRVIDDLGQTLPDGEVGEILVRSDCMLSGYYQRPDLAKIDQEGWYHSGDRGYIRQGEMYVVGRTSDLIIHAGKNIYPQDLEALASQVDGVYAGRVVAFGLPDENAGTELIAIVAETEEEDPALRREICATLRKQIGAAMDLSIQYAHVVSRGWLIKTSSGKMARQQNRQKWVKEFLKQ